MATYAQWKASKRISRTYWVHGPEPVLIQEVVSDIKAMVAAGPLDSYTLWAEADSELQIQDILFQQPLLDGAPRLIHVKQAHLLQSFRFLSIFLKELKTTLPTTYLVLESSEAELPELVAPLARKLHTVRCTSPNADDLIALVRRWGGLSELSARTLLEWSSGNVTDSWHMCNKLRLLGLKDGVQLSSPVFQAIADSFCEGFVPSLLASDKPAACAAAEELSSSDVPAVCSLLERRLEQLELLMDYARSGGSLRYVRSVPGLSYVTVQELLPVLSRYDTGRIKRCRTLLALIDAEARTSYQTGLLEALTALW